MQAQYYDPVIGRFYGNDPVGFSNIHNFNRYSYANNNPYKYFDPDGMDSYLVSRRLEGNPAGSHSFIVSDAAFMGDQSAVISSFGDQGNGKMGSVVNIDKGPSAQTYEADQKAWFSLGNGNKPEGIFFREIDATDVYVEHLVDSVKNDKNYFYVPSVTSDSVNSNSAAGARLQMLRMEVQQTYQTESGTQATDKLIELVS